MAGQLVWQIAGRITQLKPDLVAAGLPSALQASLDDGPLAKLPALLSTTQPDDRLISTQVQSAEEIITSALAAADARYEKAYLLGFGLAELCRLPPRSEKHDFDVWSANFEAHVGAVQMTLADLASSMPAHSCRAVTLSLGQWKQWVARPRLSKREVRWPNDGVQIALARQAQLWRAVLSGEKLGKDMLDGVDYVRASKTLFRRSIEPLRTWAKVAVAVASILVMVGIGVTIYFIIAAKTKVQALSAALLSVLAAFGISGASLKRILAAGGAEVGDELWGAELDIAIAQRVTVPPGDWSVELDKIDAPPASGLDRHVAVNSRSVHRLAKAIGSKIARRGQRKIRRLLHDECEYQPVGRGKPFTDRKIVATELVKRRVLGSHARELIAGLQPGTLVSVHESDDGHTVHHVWTFTHGKITRLQEFDDYNNARTKAGLGPLEDDPSAPATSETTPRRRRSETEVAVR